MRYVSDAAPGITRRRSGRGFSYRDAEGKLVRDRAALKRIKALVIPPAWRDVWICPNPAGHIQVTARDAKGRKQYRYHGRWRDVRDENKYAKLVEFGDALPKLRKKVDEDLGQRGLPRSKVLATVVRLLELTLIRVGNEEYAKANESYGLTTLRNRHVEIEGSKLRFRFKGKSGKTHDVEVADRRLARIVQQSQALPGQEIFQYLDDESQAQPVSSGDVNDYLREVMGQEFTAKDFRTWAGSVIALGLLHGGVGAVEAVKIVAQRLGNTPAMSRKHYVHPAVLEAFSRGVPEGKIADELETQEAELLKLLRS